MAINIKINVKPDEILRAAFRLEKNGSLNMPLLLVWSKPVHRFDLFGVVEVRISSALN